MESSRNAQTLSKASCIGWVLSIDFCVISLSWMTCTSVVMDIARLFSCGHLGKCTILLWQEREDNRSDLISCLIWLILVDVWAVAISQYPQVMKSRKMGASFQLLEKYQWVGWLQDSAECWVWSLVCKEESILRKSLHFDLSTHGVKSFT